MSKRSAPRVGVTFRCISGGFLHNTHGFYAHVMANGTLYIEDTFSLYDDEYQRMRGDRWGRLIERRGAVRIVHKADVDEEGYTVANPGHVFSYRSRNAGDSQSSIWKRRGLVDPIPEEKDA